MSKVNELGLRLDADRMFYDLVWEFAKAIDSVADDLLSQMKSRALTNVVQSSLKKVIIFEGYDEIEAQVGSDHWQAFLDNYGVGSLMATESQNPYLSEYKNSEFWNYLRLRTFITGRRAGTYIVPDWEGGDGYVTRQSNGGFSGISMEHINWGNNKNLTSTPRRPSFFLEHSFEFVKPLFQKKLREVYEKFPFHKYIKGGG